MRHTKNLLDAQAGELVPSSQAFRALHVRERGNPSPALAPAHQLDGWQTQLLQSQVVGQQLRRQAAEQEQTAGAAARSPAAWGGRASRQRPEPDEQMRELQALLQELRKRRPSTDAGLADAVDASTLAGPSTAAEAAPAHAAAAADEPLLG